MGMNPVLVLVVLMLALTSCKKQDVVASAAPPPAPRPGAQMAPEQVIIPAGTDMDETLSQLSMALRGYVYSTKTKPKDYQDFITHVHVEAPPPPDGKEYAIFGGNVILADHKK